MPSNSLEDLFLLENQLDSSNDPIPPTDEDDSPTSDATPPPPTSDDDTPSFPPEEDNLPIGKEQIDALISIGLLTPPSSSLEDDEYVFDGSEESFKEIIDATKQTMYADVTQSLLTSLPHEIKPILEYALQGGSSIQEFIQLTSDASSVLSLDLSTQDAQKRILQEYYLRTTRHTPERISRTVDRLAQDPDDLREAAMEAHEDLSQYYETLKQQKIEEAARMKEEEKQLLQQRAEALNSAISKSEFIHPNRRAKVRAFFFQPFQDPSNPKQTTTSFNYTISQILSNPEHQAQLADILLDYDAKAGFSLDRFEKRVKTKATQSFQNLLQSKTDPKVKLQSQSSQTKQPPSDFDLSNFFLNF